MKVSVKKKTIKIIIAIILIIAIIAVGIIATKTIINNKEIKQTEEKLNQINAEELEKKLIEELKETQIYLNVKNEDTLIGTEFENIDGFITAKVTVIEVGKEDINSVEIPCFKIESNNGKFKNISYFINTQGIEKTIQETVENTFQKEYNIDLLLKDNNSYNRHFRKSGQSKKIESTDNDSFKLVYELITNEEIPRNSMYGSIIFGK